MIDAVDLFCGAGGLTAGLIHSSINVKAGYDINRYCRYAYEKNNKTPFIEKDVKKVTKEELLSFYQKSKYKLLAGCAPCQPFSAYSNGKDISNDERWPLLYEFSRLIIQCSPDFVTMENVPNVVKHDVYHDFVNNLKKQGYFVWADTVNCVDYGIPQNRKRHVLLASKLGDIELIKPTHVNNHKTVKDTISYLNPIESGKADANDKLHKAVLLSEINKKRIRASKQGGSWKDWPEELILNCHKSDVGKKYVGVYGRMEWDKPSPTMTTHCYGYGNGRFGHPEQDRAISLREAALLQTFPKNYVFCENDEINVRELGKMIGNAVPVRLGEVIGQSFNQHLVKFS